MSGKLLENVKPIKQGELFETYEWVKNNVFPIIDIKPENATPIGSFNKKPINEESGDIDIAIDISEAYKKMKLNEISSLLYDKLSEHFETKYIKGFDQVSIKAPIRGDEKFGFVQVDLMPTRDLNWSKFMYHSPNLKEGESKYNGALRNLLLFSIITESYFIENKLYEGQVEEYNALVIRLPSGVWDVRKSLRGKTGLIKTPKILEAEFITRDPKDVIRIALGEGYNIKSANSFETLWEIIHKKHFIHKNVLEKIINKFHKNIKKANIDPPKEAIKKYPHIFEGVLKLLKPKRKIDIVRQLPKDPPEVVKNMNINLKKLEDLIEKYAEESEERVLEELKNIFLKNFNIAKLYTINFFDLVKKIFYEEQIKEIINKYMEEEKVKKDFVFHFHGLASAGVLNYVTQSEIVEKIEKSKEDFIVRFPYIEDYLRRYLPVDYFKELKLKSDWLSFLKQYGISENDIDRPKTRGEFERIKKEFIHKEKGNKIYEVLKLLRGAVPSKDFNKIIEHRIQRNQFTFMFFCFSFTINHLKGDYIIDTISELTDMVYNGVDKKRSSFKKSTYDTLYSGFIDKLISVGIIKTYKIGNTIMCTYNEDFRDDNRYLQQAVPKFKSLLNDIITEYDIDFKI